MYSKSMITFYDRGDSSFLRPCSGGRDRYYELRSEIRRIRRHSPKCMDVLWYQYSLGLTTFTDAVTERQIHYGRVYAIGITRPRHKLP